MRTVVNCLTVSAILLGFGAAANAQDSSDQTIRELEEIIVTAQRREESLQDAALAIDAMESDDLVRGGIESAMDLGALSPSLAISKPGGPFASIFVRGVGSLNANPLLDTAVAQNYDGVYLGRASGATGQTLYDIERVELLKGPQGTLYGRNATGGVLNYIPKKPELGDFSGYVQAEFGNYDKFGIEGAFNFPLGDNAAGRFSASSLDRDGYSNDGSNDADSYSMRGQLLFEPTEELSIRFGVDHTVVGGVGANGDILGTYNNNGFAGSLSDFTPSGLAIDSGATSAGGNALRGTILGSPSFAFYSPVDSNELFQDYTFTGILAELNYEMDAGTLTIIPAYREYDQEFAFYGPGFGPSPVSEDQEQVTLEARFTTALDGAFNGVFGAFYFDEEIVFKANFNQDFVSPIQNYDPKGDSWAVFAQGTFDVSDTFRINAGLRYTEDTKSVVSNVSHTFIVFCGGPPGSPAFLTPPASFGAGCQNRAALPTTYDAQEYIDTLIADGRIPPGSTPNDGFYPLIGGIPGVLIDVASSDIPEAVLTYGEITYRAGIEWDLAENSLFYVGFEHGYRAGGVDVSAVAPSYEPEFIDAITIGSKNRFLDNTLQLNLEAFYWEYEDQQVSYFAILNGGPSFLTANANSTIQGVDIDLLWAATDNTTIGAKVQFLDSTFDTLMLNSDPNGGRYGCPSQGVGSNGFETYDCSGIGLLFAPEFGMDLTFEYIFNLNKFDLTANVDVSHRSEQETDFSLLPETTTDAYTTVNFAATLAPTDADWAITAYVRNLSDERYVYSSNLAPFGLYLGTHNAPRTYGVRMHIGF